MKGIPMKNKLLLSLVVAFVMTLTAATAYASGNELAYKRVGELDELDSASIASGDMIPVWDASTNKVKKVDATDFPYGGGAITLDDGTTDSPALTFTDETDETAAFVKLDSAYLTLTTEAADGLNVLVGSVKIGNGVPTGTINGEDLYVEGIMEVDGAVRLDGAVTATSTLAVSGASTLSGDVVGDGGDQLYGFLQDQVASTTAAITAAQCGKTFVSNSADVMALPEASTVLGCRLTFVCGTADDFDINPDDADIIGPVSTTNGTTGVVTLAPSAGDAVRCTDIGGSLTLEAIAADRWAQVGGGNGIWTDVN